ncbi:hypothetical protein ACFQUU_28220 [Herbaspirillum sp. GCM10030257]|uniref:hypothetical protein n=1 Tax=Herbaspirillum sp. GCM10030257 TaxID=3273393 RepID=UPI0036079254
MSDTVNSHSTGSSRYYNVTNNNDTSSHALTDKTNNTNDIREGVAEGLGRNLKAFGAWLGHQYICVGGPRQTAEFLGMLVTEKAKDNPMVTLGVGAYLSAGYLYRSGVMWKRVMSETKEEADLVNAAYAGHTDPSKLSPEELASAGRQRKLDLAVATGANLLVGGTLAVTGYLGAFRGVQAMYLDPGFAIRQHFYAIGRDLSQGTFSTVNGGGPPLTSAETKGPALLYSLGQVASGIAMDYASSFIKEPQYRIAVRAFIVVLAEATDNFVLGWVAGAKAARSSSKGKEDLQHAELTAGSSRNVFPKLFDQSLTREAVLHVFGNVAGGLVLATELSDKLKTPAEGVNLLQSLVVNVGVAAGIGLAYGRIVAIWTAQGTQRNYVLDNTSGGSVGSTESGHSISTLRQPQMGPVNLVRVGTPDITESGDERTGAGVGRGRTRSDIGQVFLATPRVTRSAAPNFLDTNEGRRRRDALNAGLLEQQQWIEETFSPDNLHSPLDITNLNPATAIDTSSVEHSDEEYVPDSVWRSAHDNTTAQSNAIVQQDASMFRAMLSDESDNLVTEYVTDLTFEFPSEEEFRPIADSGPLKDKFTAKIVSDISPKIPDSEDEKFNSDSRSTDQRGPSVAARTASTSMPSPTTDNVAPVLQETSKGNHEDVEQGWVSMARSTTQNTKVVIDPSTIDTSDFVNSFKNEFMEKDSIWTQEVPQFKNEQLVSETTGKKSPGSTQLVFGEPIPQEKVITAPDKKKSGILGVIQLKKLLRRTDKPVPEDPGTSSSDQPVNKSNRSNRLQRMFKRDTSQNDPNGKRRAE